MEPPRRHTQPTQRRYYRLICACPGFPEGLRHKDSKDCLIVKLVVEEDPNLAPQGPPR